jgi:Family of unknown function (DUF6599)
MKQIKAGLGFFLVCWLGLGTPAHSQEPSASSLKPLLPDLPDWTLTEAPAAYFPGTLFEYIDGAAENYLSYGFRELVVGNYKKEGPAAALTVEIYDMGDGLRAFGVYSSERYPESQFLRIGGQGYWEDGSLNFVAGRFYVKLLCFDCGSGAEAELTAIARQVEKKAGGDSHLPPLLGLFPAEGLIANSEKFILQNVLGYGFLHHGYVANYRVQDQEFDLFIVQGSDSPDAENMVNRYLEAHGESGPAGPPGEGSFHVRDRYSGNIFLARSGSLILGVMRIKDGFEDLGRSYLKLLLQAVKNKASSLS